MSTRSWNECTPHDRWIGRCLRPIQPMDMLALIHLYQPVVGPKAIGLYLTLAYQSEPPSTQTHLELMKGLQLPLGEVLSARYRLEGVGLWNTFQDDKGVYRYECIPPLTPARFFQSDVLSITLFNRVGNERFRQLHRQLMEASPSEKRQGRDLTKTFQQVFGSLSPAEIASAAEVEEAIGWSGGDEDSSLEEGKAPTFKQDEADLSMVRARLQPYVEEAAWSKEVEEQIREIRFLYQLDDWDLIKALQNPYVTQNGQIHVNRLRSFVRSQYRLRFGRPPVVVDRFSSKWSAQPNEPAPSPEPPEKVREPSDEERHFRTLADISPVELLAAFQKGTQIPRADLELVEDLTRNYGLPPGVINVLLEYVLYSHDFKLPRPLVEKIAGHWARKNIQTVDEAREMARKEYNWEWTKRKGKNRPSESKRTYRRNSDEDRLPKSVIQSMEKQRSVESQEWEANPEAEAFIKSKLSRMNQRMKERYKEKGGTLE
jgi:replication initiation and membrane attachment protein